MALAFTYRLVAQMSQSGEPAPLQVSAAGFAAALHGSGGSVDLWALKPDASLPLPVAPLPDLLAYGAIGTVPADPAPRPDSGLGFSCLDLLAGFVESGP